MTGTARRILVFGVVQGVGFRPFIHRLSRRLGLRGWVKNIGTGVEIHIEGPSRPGLEHFLRALREEPPPLAAIETIEERPARFAGFGDFRVRRSRGGNSFVFIAPDVSVCPECRRDIADPKDRRFRYPFTNCTDCGPRYTIVRKLPYDRPQTTMASFPMCPDCAAEYDDPADRRYHAQPIACPACGPAVRLRKSGSTAEIPGGLARAADLIRRGRVLAVKGLGGFHLVCDPRNPQAVARLRKIKGRLTKPLALMARDMDMVRTLARVSPAEARLLTSVQHPIVLLRKTVDIPGIAPHLNEVGVMLAYTPLHALLLETLGLIVATSSNPKDSPIMKDESEGIDGLCDYVLGHNRPIHMRADDSVLKETRGGTLFVRRARGYVPAPQKVPPGLEAPGHVLAVGAELKDTVAISKNGYAVVSQFLGDLNEYNNHRYFEETTAHLERLFDVRPACVVSDLHPDFHSTRWAARYARKSGIPHFLVQHHHAHVLAVLLEHGIPPGPKVLGVAWDGYGFGGNGEARGAEFLLADYAAAETFARFDPVPLPGGDLAAKQPWRMALSYLHREGFRAFPAVGLLQSIPRDKQRAIWTMLEKKSHAPLASSCGRLFDAVSALIGTAPAANEFEAEAAMRLESEAAESSSPARYSFELDESLNPMGIGFGGLIRGILADIRNRTPKPEMAAKFHNTLARVIVETARKARRRLGTETVVLCGGVFLNRLLIEKTSASLRRDGFRVLRPVRYSPGDESISLGQIGYALARLKAGKRPHPAVNPSTD